MRTLVLGLGNTILTDDGIGIYVVRAVQKANPKLDSDQISFAEASVGGIRLLDVITGYEKLVLVDAIKIPDGNPGDVCRLGLSELRALLHSGSTHDLSFTGALILGRSLAMTLPKDEQIVIVAIQVQDILSFGETCTPVVEKAIPRAVEIVLAELGA